MRNSFKPCVTFYIHLARADSRDGKTTNIYFRILRMSFELLVVFWEGAPHDLENDELLESSISGRTNV